MQRRLIVSIDLDDLNAGFGRCVGSLLRNIQCRGCNGDLILGVVHHIAAGCADLLVAVLALGQILEHRLAIRAGGHIRHFLPCAVVQPVCHACQCFTCLCIHLVDGQAAFLLHSPDLDIHPQGVAPDAGVAGHRLIPACSVIPAQHGLVRIHLKGTAGSGIRFLTEQILGRSSCGCDGQGVALSCKGNTVTAVDSEVVGTQHPVCICDTGCVVPRRVSLQFDHIGPEFGICGEAGNFVSRLHRCRDLIVP